MTLSDPQRGPGGSRIGPAMFFGIGVFLFALKFALDRTIARVVFGRGWAITNYLIPNESYTLPTLPPMERQFYLTMLAVSLPFVVIGITVTLRRLCDADLPRWLVALFFVPVVNLLFFAVLSVFPPCIAKPRSDGERAERDDAAPVAMPLGYGTDGAPATLLGCIIPVSDRGAMLVAIFLPGPIAVGATLLGANVMREYGFGLFVGMPFVVAMVSVLIYGYRTPRTLWQCISVGMLATLAAGALLIFLALDGLGCLLMLMPLGIPIAVLGAGAGYAIQRRPTVRELGSDRSMWSITLTLPLLIFVEGLAPPPISVLPVTTCVDIAAPPAQVWHNVVTFDRIDAPLDWPFRAGVAYPVRARIEGTGVGAIRYCEFSTGPFVEPITTWDEPRLLKFSVTSNPPPMREWSPFNIHPPHLENFLVSHGGEFRLIELAGGGTRVEGTTWYENRMWPQVYWRWWSDYLIHRIHTRVLTHIKTLSESPAPSARVE